MTRRTQLPRPPAGPPVTAEAGAAHVRAALIKMFDKGDGTGADWLLMLESLYRAGFRLFDDHLKEDAAGRRMMGRVHAGAELRITGGYADGSGASDTAPDVVNPPLAPIAGVKSPKPRPH